MRKFLHEGVITDQLSTKDLVKEKFFKSEREINYVKLFGGLKHIPSDNRHNTGLRIAAFIASLLVKELVIGLIERNCVFLFPKGNIKLSIRCITNDGRRIFRPCLDIINVPGSWKLSLWKMWEQEKFVVVKFSSKLFNQMIANIRKGMRYRNHNENGF